MKSEDEMRALMVLTIIALLIEPAYSQRKLKPPVPQDDPLERKLEWDRKQIEQQYRAVVDRIPDQKKKNTDPWHDVRGTEPKKKSN